MRPQDGAVAREIIEIVHDDGDEEVQHQKHAKEDEGDEIDVGQRRAAGDFARVLRYDGMALGADASHHNVLPRLARTAAEEQQETEQEIAEVVVPVDGRTGVEGEVAENLHPHYAVDEEKNENQETDVRQRLEGLNECPEQGFDAFPASEEFDQASGAEQPEKPNGNHSSPKLGHENVSDRPDDRYEIESIPRVLEVVSEAEGKQLQSRFDDENSRENPIEDLQRQGVRWRGPIHFHHHDYRVETNDDHDEYFKLSRRNFLPHSVL